MEKNEQHTVPEVLKRLARALGTEVNNRRLYIPEEFGKGYCTGYIFNEHIRMMVMDYELRENLTIDNPDSSGPAQMILFKFQHVIPDTGTAPAERQAAAVPSVLITTASMKTDQVAVHTNTSVINIEMDADYLNGLFDVHEKSPVLQSLLQNTQPLLFEQVLHPSLQKIVDEMLSEPAGETFELFFMRVKAEELICRLLMELEKRDERHLYPLNGRDTQAVYKVKEHMMQHLATPPLIQQLAADAGMSPTKLKRLFRQIFGNSIFNYYQEFRMKEAARLLKEEKLSVSAVGYQLGFTNLSHFSRVFNEHTGMKPKQYSRG